MWGSLTLVPSNKLVCTCALLSCYCVARFYQISRKSDKLWADLLPRAHAQGVKQSVLSVCLSSVVVVITKIARSGDIGT